MRELILPIGCSVLQTAEDFCNLRMQPGNSGFKCSLLAGFDNIPFNVSPFLSEDLFNMRRVDTSILDQPFQGASCNFTPNRVKAGNRDRFRSIVHYYIHPSCLLKSPDIAPIAADNASLHFLIGKNDY
jgi:hypothetical protein